MFCTVRLMGTEGFDRVDVAICGAGLAGATLAQQLRRELPDLSLAILDPLVRPLPEAAFKVGESTTEIGAFYLAEVVGLRDHLETAHLPKLGFRFFFPAEGGFATRPEVGLCEFPKVPSYNVDRGRLENELRRRNEAAGVRCLEGCSVARVELADDDREHTVGYTTASGEAATLRARWVVDATGRRRLLQNQLGSTRTRGRPCSAAWFRVPGRLDVDAFVPRSEREWHGRLPEKQRYLSTNHLMGPGYWVWLIPLPSDHTSVGIVGLDEMHPPRELASWPRTLDWLERHEPVLRAALDATEPVDFHSIRRYSVSSRKIYSEKRWACIGEAAAFADPFYAVATDLIAFGNMAVTQMIREDCCGTLDRSRVRALDRSMLGMNDALTHNIQLGYPGFGNPVVALGKVIWDTSTAWGLLAPRMFNGTFTDVEATRALNAITSRSFFLTQRMQALFVDWNEKSGRRLSFDFVDLLKLSFLRTLRERNLVGGKSLEQLRDDHVQNMRMLEALAQAVQLVAVEDVIPEARAELEARLPLDPWAVSLHPERWQADGLFEPPADVDGELARALYVELRAAFRLMEERA
jgi:flavin-dependent dehydrogenase